MPKKVEEIYQKKDLHQHILDRPNSYIGSTKLTTEERYIVEESEESKIVKKIVEYNPGLIKIFDEILVNAIDHTVREKTANIIKVNIDRKSGEISVYNNGPGIPVVIHKEYKIYVPELVFGNLLTSSNYDDTVKRTVGGQNGLGANCANIFSKKFIVETVDENSGLYYYQEFTNNMFDKTEPIIKKSKVKPYTKITFLPDYSRFKMKKLTKDAEALMKCRVYDTTACTDKKVSVYLNEIKLSQKDFLSYMSLYTNEKLIHEIFTENNLSWEIGVFFTEKPGQVSFVNGINTYNGGKHVEHAMNQIIKKLTNVIQTKKKITDIKPSYIKERLFIFVKSIIVNPTFTSQSKEYLTTNIKDFDIKIDFSDKFIDKLYKSRITDDLLSFVKYKNEKALTKNVKNTSRKININVPKLIDANYAGTSKSNKCTLILTEGDSAKTFAVSGLNIVGRDYYAVFPLKGKVLNVREATQNQLLNNEEVNNLKKIIGLQHGKKYESLDGLRYGKIMLLTDADSVTFDTPVLLKNIFTEEIITKPICELYDDNNWIKDINSDKEYNTVSDYLVWSDNGWTNIKSIMRHKVSKPIYRINTSKGCVDVTTDHSILNKQGKNITVNDVILNQTELLHKQYFQEKIFDYNINKDLAYAMGYFMADGFCTLDCKTRQKNGTKSVNSKWEIVCVHEEPLLKLQSIFSKYENNNNTTIFEIVKVNRKYLNKDHFYKLQAKKNRKQVSLKYRNMFYNSLREKQVPVEILNSSVEIQQEFLNGFYEGDGETGKTKCFDIQHKTSILGMFQLIQNCGYSPSINCNHKKLNAYIVLMSKNNCRSVHTVKKLINVSEKYKNTYVYDLETENHHFHAGIGNIIVHNTDGIHISGLIMNFFHHWWPELLEIPGFLINMRTPILKASKGKEILEFYSHNDYVKWKENLGKAVIKKYKIKYYKGLGTSTANEAKDVFKKMNKNLVQYVSNDDILTKKAILLAFEKKQADNRKAWLQNHKIEEVDYTTNEITYNDFINKYLVQFSLGDISRSIPSIYDGLKPSQRKVLYTMFKKNYTDEIKVAQFAGAVGELTAYHHGETSLYSTIINMAQNYPGSNNINLLKPNGQFGCLDPETKVLMYNGGIKKAKDIKIGDLLIGDNSLPRKVLRLTNGVDDMFKITLENGDWFKVNSEHILTFKIKCHKLLKYNPLKLEWVFTYFDKDLLKMCKITFKDSIFNEPSGEVKNRESMVYEYIDELFYNINNNDIYDIKLQDYLSIDSFTKSFMFAIKNNKPLYFENKYKLLNPEEGYLCGLNLTSEILSIPNKYKFSSLESRFNIIKGIVNQENIEISILKKKMIINLQHLNLNLINDIYFIVNSLGIYAYNKDSYLHIIGDNIYKLFKHSYIENLKYFISEKTFQIKITHEGIGIFNGWELDSNHRFLLNDFTITHNSRLQNGKDSASPRYIFTEINEITKKIFNPLDFPILNYLNDDGFFIEPENYIPIIPMVLINGCQGIGTGFSTYIPPYNPQEIIENMERKLQGKKYKTMIPYFKNYKGKIINSETNDKSYDLLGVYEKINELTLKITEIPISISIEEYVTFIKGLIEANHFINNYNDNSSDNQINISITFNDSKTLNSFLQTPQLLYKNLKLSKSLSINNMHLFDKEGKIKKYDDIYQILDEFMDIRLTFNQKRKEYLINSYKNALFILNNKIRFIKEIIDGTLIVYKRKKDEIINDLIKSKYDKIEDSYDYLLSMPMYSFTFEKIKDLEDKISKNSVLLEDIQNKTKENLLTEDLINLKSNF